MKLFLLLIVGGGIIFPMDCVEGIRFGREAKAFKQMNSNNSLSYASYYPTFSPSPTIGETDSDSLVQQGQEIISNGVDNEDINDSIATQSISTASTVDQVTTTFATTISTAHSTSILKTDSDLDLIWEDVNPTLSTPSSTLATESTFLVDQEVNTSNSDASSVSIESDETDGCTVLVVDSEENVLSVEIPFYYRLQTTTFDDGIITNIESNLLSGMCSVSESIRRLSDANQVFEWNSKPKDTVSENYDCTPSSDEAQLCNIVEAGMTVYYDGHDDKAAIETHAYQQIEDQFSSLSVDDSRVVSVQYLGNSPPIEEEDESFDTVQEEEIVSISYVPSPFVITASGILLFALMIGIYGVLMRGRRKGASSSDNDTLPPPPTEEVESIYATKEDESQATTVLHANPSDVDSSIPILPRYSDNDDETMHTLKQFVLGEDKETRTEWERLGILPVVA